MSIRITCRRGFLGSSQNIRSGFLYGVQNRCHSVLNFFPNTGHFLLNWKILLLYDRGQVMNGVQKGSGDLGVGLMNVGSWTLNARLKRCRKMGSRVVELLKFVNHGVREGVDLGLCWWQRGWRSRGDGVSDFGCFLTAGSVRRHKRHDMTIATYAMADCAWNCFNWSFEYTRMFSPTVLDNAKARWYWYLASGVDGVVSEWLNFETAFAK